MTPRPTVLIVDDYPDALDVWDVFLQIEGFTVLTASDGHTALELATTARPDLAVLDLELPGLTGYEVAEALRQHDATRHMPLIAATGHSQPDQIDRALAAGFDLVLVKPCEPDALVREIRRLLDAPRHPEGGVTPSSH